MFKNQFDSSFPTNNILAATAINNKVKKCWFTVHLVWKSLCCCVSSSTFGVSNNHLTIQANHHPPPHLHHQVHNTRPDTMLYLLYILFSCLQALLRTCWIHDLPNCISLFVIHIRNCLRPIFIIGGANNSLVGLIVCLWQLTFLSRCKLKLCIREPYLIIKSRIDSILHQHPCL